MADVNALSAQEIGRRMRLARQNAGLRQSDAVRVIEKSRPTLVSIEKGTRRARIRELEALAGHYGISISSIFRPYAVHTDIPDRFRKLSGAEDICADEAVKLFDVLIRADVELENTLGRGRRRNYPPERGINQGNVVDLARRHAQELRDWLGLGCGPIPDIFSVIELDLGIRLYQHRLSSESEAASLFAYDEAVGACIFLNADQPRIRRIRSAAQELGHFCGVRRDAAILKKRKRPSSRSERYVDAFGRAFLAPAEGLSKSFRQLKEATGETTRRLIILLADQYSISRQTCYYRLEEIGILKKGSWGQFENSEKDFEDIRKKEHFEKMIDLLDPNISDADCHIPRRIALMAHAAWSQELLSEGVLAELLNVHRIDLRRIIYDIEIEPGIEESKADEILELSD